MDNMFSKSLESISGFFPAFLFRAEYVALKRLEIPSLS